MTTGRPCTVLSRWTSRATTARSAGSGTLTSCKGQVMWVYIFLAEINFHTLAARKFQKMTICNGHIYYPMKFPFTFYLIDGYGLFMLVKKNILAYKKKSFKLQIRLAVPVLNKSITLLGTRLGRPTPPVIIILLTMLYLKLVVLHNMYTWMNKFCVLFCEKNMHTCILEVYANIDC